MPETFGTYCVTLNIMPDGYLDRFRGISPCLQAFRAITLPRARGRDKMNTRYYEVHKYVGALFYMTTVATHFPSVPLTK